MVKKGKDLQTVDREIFSVIGQLFFLFHSSPTRENLWCSVALSFRDQSFAFDKVLLIKELCVYLSYVRKTLPQNNSVSCGQWCEWAFGQWMNYIPGKSFIRTRSLTSCQQPVCCGTLSNSKRGSRHIAVMFIFVPSHRRQKIVLLVQSAEEGSSFKEHSFVKCTVCCTVFWPTWCSYGSLAGQTQA